MKLPPDVQFDEKVRLFIWRPHGLIDESAVNRIITILGEMEAGSAEPFNRFSDTSAAEAVDLNFKYIFHVSLFRRASSVPRRGTVDLETGGVHHRFHV